MKLPSHLYPAIAAIGLLLLAPLPRAGAQAAGLKTHQDAQSHPKPIPGPREVKLKGEQARTLISLLMNESKDVVTEMKSSGDPHKSEIVLQDLSVEAVTTYKFDTDDPFYRLDNYYATAKVGSNDNAVEIGDATALYKFFSDLRVTPDLGLEGAFLEMSYVDCKTDANIDISKPERFQCDIKIPY